MNCPVCNRILTGDLFVREGVPKDGTPIISIESTPDRNWICCDACNEIRCHNCCQYSESGYCDSCIEKYQLYEYLVQTGLIKPKKDKLNTTLKGERNEPR